MFVSVLAYLVIASFPWCKGHTLPAGLRAVKDVFHTNPCEDHGTGIFPNYTAKCQRYYRCSGYQVEERMLCEEGTKFSVTTGSCLPSADVVCAEPHCPISGDGFFITPGTSCRGYYQCYNGHRKDYLCPQGAVFNRDSQICVRSGGTCYEMVCAGRVNGVYTDTTHACRRSYYCEGGALVGIYGCPRGTLHNGTACVASSRVHCSSPHQSAVSLAVLITDQCSGQPNGPAPNEDDQTCQSYHLCQAGETISTLRCPLDQRFNGHRCAPRQLTQCQTFCMGKPDAYYPDSQKQCREFIKCVRGKSLQRKACPTGNVYNGVICVPENLYQCPSTEQGLVARNIDRRCSKLDDGFYRNFRSGCTDYFYCSDGAVLFHGSCNAGTVFDGKACTPAEEFFCYGPEPWTECTGMNIGPFTEYSNRQLYFYCWNGTRTLFACPSGLVFNGQFCVPNNSFNLNSCQGKFSGYYSISHSNCRSYYYCSNNHKLTYICPGVSVFNGSKCVDAKDYNCSSKSGACLRKVDGYYPDITTKCQNYYYCFNENKITTLSCEMGKVFNGKSCSFDTCLDRCKDLPDGVFTEPSTACTKYYQCTNGKYVNSFTCSEGLFYDGTNCVEASNALCPSITKIKTTRHCQISQNGFYQDLESACQNYFYCINGVMTELSCPVGQLFNGELCVQSTQYNCPRVHTWSKASSFTNYSFENRNDLAQTKLSTEF